MWRNLTEPFSHRFDDDGNYYSICGACMQTVARGRCEQNLLLGEGQHHCLGLPRSYQPTAVSSTLRTWWNRQLRLQGDIDSDNCAD